MNQSYYHKRIAFLASSLFISTILCGTFISCGEQPTSNSQKQEEQISVQMEQEAIRARVDPGEPGVAVAYYTDILTELGLKNWADPLPADPNQALDKLAETQNLDLMLKFLGYTDLVPADFNKNIENLSSEELNSRYPGNVLASAFFAPKITDVSDGNPLNINVGWRKIVYIKTRASSAAAGKGIDYGLLLFNKFQGKGDRDTNPFEPRADKSNESKTTQFMLIDIDGTSLKYHVYFLVYGRISEGGKLKPTLDASFDARAPEFQPARPYYVPNACAQCHGAETAPQTYDLKKVKLNFLDTDHWFDRVQSGDDFAFLQSGRYGVLYDGGTNVSSPQFEKAFVILRQINEIIKDQNYRVDGIATGGAASFQYRAVKRWSDLHASDPVTTDTGHKDVFQRALPNGTTWDANADPATKPDKELLPLLNRYCYRCHSSVRFSIFDRSAVASRKSAIKFRLTTTNKALWMPQDRELDPQIKDNLKLLVDKLQ